jgi:hypothetical protein
MPFVEEMLENDPPIEFPYYRFRSLLDWGDIEKRTRLAHGGG